MNAALPITTATFSRPAWIGLAVLLVLSFLLFWVRTTPVRLANTDDAAIQGIAHNGSLEQYVVDNAVAQGRFYYALPGLGRITTGFYQIDRPWLFSLVRALAFYAQVGLAAWLVARLAGHAAWGVALGLLITSTLHIPQTFFPLLSFPGFWVGFGAILTGLHFQLSHVERPRAWVGGLAGLCLLFACLMHDSFVFFFPLFPAIGWARRSPRWLRDSLPAFTALLAYVATYLLFARLHPSQYDGTQVATNLPAALGVLGRQMVGVLPGVELFLQRQQGTEPAPLLHAWPEIARAAAATPWLDLLLALANAATLTWLLARCSRPTPALARAWPLALGFAVALNVPIAFTAKYQVFIFQRTFPYVYAFYSYFFIILAVTGLLALAGRWRAVEQRPRLALAALGLVLAAACSSAAVANYRTLQSLARTYN